MKRFHVHLHVEDLQASIAFYSRLFSAEPARIESDYAKWMLEDPRVNFAISTRGSKPGLDHLGFQVDSAEELAEMRAAAQSADMAMLEEGETTCCYARSEKHWITDPQGVAWEQFHTLGNIPVFNEAAQSTTGAACCAPAKAESNACCTPAKAEPASCGAHKSAAAASCCGPATANKASKTSCC
jgi:catechol 2,3-dioxygenase-like lactoylglutathione lyase family enzyme